MAAPILTVEPQFVYAGDTLLLTKSLADYSASDGWSLSYFFVSTDGAGKTFNFSATASGSDFSISFDTSNVEVGKYQGRAKVTKSGQSFTVWVGQLEILASLEQSADTRSQAKRTLDKINAVIEGRADSSILKSKINGTEIERIPISDLLKLQDEYTRMVAVEDSQKPGGNKRRGIIYGTFARP